MKIDSFTLKILQNFSNINKNILIKSGNVLVSKSDDRLVQARAELDNEFPVTFGIYDLSNFLNTLSLMKEPDIEFSDKMLFLKEDTAKIQYKYTPENMLVVPNKDKVVLPSIEVEFLLPSDKLNAVLKAALVMKMPYVAISCNRDTIKISAVNIDDILGDKYEIDLQIPCDKKFILFLNIINTKMLISDYYVRIFKNKVAEFQTDKLTYWVAAQKESEYSD